MRSPGLYEAMPQKQNKPKLGMGFIRMGTKAVIPKLHPDPLDPVVSLVTEIPDVGVSPNLLHPPPQESVP